MSAGILKLLHELKLQVAVGQTTREYPFYDMDFEFEYDKQCNGLIELAALEVNQLFSGATLLVVYCDVEFIISAGPTETQLQTKWFSYNGPQGDFYFSNVESEAIQITYFSFIETPVVP